MLYRVLADAVVLVHLAWIVFLIFGAFIGVRYRWARYMHLGGLAFAFTIQIFDWYCPLTHLEAWLRARHDPFLSFTGSFIVHYAEKLVYLELSRTLIFAFTVVLAAVTAWVYLRGRKRNATGTG